MALDFPDTVLTRPFLPFTVAPVCFRPVQLEESSHGNRVSLARRRRHPARRTRAPRADARGCAEARAGTPEAGLLRGPLRSEEHTSELQSPCNIVCRLLLEKKKHT